MVDNDFLFRGDIAAWDPAVAELIRHETARQERCLILIPSESTVPYAVREALASSFHNLYAEGYPLDSTRTLTQAEILDYNARLPEYRRLADKRYYKGTEYADIIEALARRRAAELFSTADYSADQLFVNVQALSGAPANNAIYSGLLNVGDTMMGLDLLEGGHLTHGSPVNRSGKWYNAVGYTVDPQTEKLDYDRILALAQLHQPRLIIAGYTSYPFAPDWHKFREIADAVGAYLMADIAHVAGLVIAGVYPNPVGIADVVSFTTHKTMAGPRGAVIITHRGDVANKVDRAVFPGEQGGPHVNAMTALAVALRLSHTEQFKTLQRRTVENAVRFAEKLAARGLRVPYGGTDTHMLLVDCKSIIGPDGTPLSGDMAARILDLAGIVANRNTIPGDASALRASGLRFGTPWISQRGFGVAEIDQLADLIADLLLACVPFSYTGRKNPEPRAKVDFDTLERVKLAVRDLAARAGIDTEAGESEYPHVYYLDGNLGGSAALTITGAHAARFLDAALTSDVLALGPGEQQLTHVLEGDGQVMANGVLERLAHGYRLIVDQQGGRVSAWLRALSDGFVLFDPTDPYAKLPGPVDVQIDAAADLAAQMEQIRADSGYAERKAYCIGINGPAYAGPAHAALPVFSWQEPQLIDLKRTPLHDLHGQHGAKLGEFAGYEMPLWYTSVGEEHQSVRTRAGLFDVTHMGVFDVQGPGAAAFLDVVTTNEVPGLAVGESQYTYLLDLAGVPLDDLMIYRVAEENYLLVVNASNNDKNWAWLNAVRDGAAQIDAAHPHRRIGGRERFTLRDLRNPTVGADQRVDLALQGPESTRLLLALGSSAADKACIEGLAWAGVTRVTLGGYDLYVSRTGYTGERIAYELFPHPDQAAALFSDLVAQGAVPCGLAARDSLRIEAGLPLYGHELAGPHNLNPADAGFASYVKLSKPFFVGKVAFAARERARDSEIARFRLVNKGVRPPHQGDPVVDARGRVIGAVTSCSIDSEGYQLGQAYLKRSAAAVDTPIGVFCGSGRAPAGKAASALSVGDRVTLPESAVIISRFPSRKRK
ncbi:MAG: serine hydroxymethyltransferase [Chloroflexi bacterium]|nr:serine hydroxymethyltransferase [Chloroflexota bacterium]